jgi:23S rRNA (cytidine1920-2'-O)/16S rRNA (cytidine1409-2'-O)-methyltransferase
VRKLRIDQLLVDRGLVESRTRAQALLMAGLVYSGERRLDKPGLSVAEDIALELRGRLLPALRTLAALFRHQQAEWAGIIKIGHIVKAQLIT